MAMMVVLLGDAESVFSVREEQVSELAELGVTSVAVVRDDDVVGVVLEGWLFDPDAAGRSAAEALGAAPSSRALHPVLHMAVSAANQGGRDGATTTDG